MKRALFIIFLFFSYASSAQEPCSIMNSFGEIFKIDKVHYDNQSFLIKNIQKVDSTKCFSVLINENQNYFDYLNTHFSPRSILEELNSISDTVKLQSVYVDAIENDTVFKRVIQKVDDKVFSADTFQPDTLSMDEVLNIAVKFFSITKINPKGHYAIRFCTGINDLKETEEERVPHLEAFCFSTIFENYEGQEFNMYSEFVKGVKEVYQLNLGVDKEQRLLRAQGALFMYMRQNQALQNLLVKSYQEKKYMLPFVIID